MSDLREAAVEAPQPRLEDATAAEPSPPPSDDDRPKAAVWAVNEPEGPWCQPAHVRALEGLLGPKDAALFVDNATNHTRATSAHAGAWRLLGATRRGRRHAHVGAWNDDAFAVDIRGARHVLAVADGAGSAPLSRVGAALAVQTVTDALHRAPVLSAEHVHDAIGTTIAQLSAFATAAAVEPRTLRTTLLVAVWDTHAPTVFTAHVGDGAIALVYANTGTPSLRVVQPVNGHAGEWSGEVHCFLPDAEAHDAARAATTAHDRDGLLAVMLATDGIDDAIYPLQRHVPAMLAQWVHGVRAEDAPIAGLTRQPVTPPLVDATAHEALLEWLAFEKRGENDDRTIVVALHEQLAARVPRAVVPHG